LTNDFVWVYFEYRKEPIKGWKIWFSCASELRQQRMVITKRNYKTRPIIVKKQKFINICDICQIDAPIEMFIDGNLDPALIGKEVVVLSLDVDDAHVQLLHSLEKIQIPSFCLAPRVKENLNQKTRRD
jgi:hypothetical protein